MESIEKLRSAESFSELAISIIGDDNSFRSVQEFWCALADEIEAEIAERYIELPVDADGVPIRLGDRVASRRWSDGTWVSQLSCNDSGWWVVDRFGATEDPNNCRHAKPRTVEDVLHDFAKDVLSMNRNRFAESPDEIHIPDGAKYAAELREMMGGDDG